MIRMLFALLTSLLLPLTAQAQSGVLPQNIEGVWQTEARDGSWGYVRFAPCGSVYCGTLIGGDGASVNTDFFGTILVTDMQWTGEGFTGGQILDVETGRVYLSRMEFREANQLRVSGCVLGGLICGGQTWVRVE